MAVSTPPSAPERTNTLREARGAPEDGVIEDARARQRRHRWIGALTVAAMVAAGLIAGFSGGGSTPGYGKASRRSSGARTPLAGSSLVAELKLAAGAPYDAIAVVKGRVVLYGPAPPSLGHASTSSTCSVAFVNPSTLALAGRRSGSCANPAMFGRRVIPTISIDRHLPASSGGPSAVVRIAHLVPVAPGYLLGPVVMRFPTLAYGQTAPAWIYGGGDLWLYDWVNHFDLLRISATTGRVVQRLVVPRIQTPLLAYNRDGLWIAPAGESSGALYRLRTGASQATPVFALGRDGFAWWLVASGHSLWIDDQPRPVKRRATVWELHGPAALPVWHHAQSRALSTVEAQAPFASPSLVVGNGGDGLWTTALTNSGGQQQAVRIDPRTGAAAVAAALTPPRAPHATGPSISALAAWQATTFKRSLYVLDPAVQAPKGGRSVGGVLYRVTPRGRRPASG